MNPEAIGKYRVQGLLGQGAMGEVYLGEDPYIGRAVAIKVLKATAEDEQERFVHEARIVGTLSHPNIVVLHDFGFHEGKPYLVMEHLGGVSLEAWLTEPHLLVEHLGIMDGLLGAVAYAHGRGVLHRDLKPSNIQVMPDGQCKLMDFGIARAPASKLTATGMVLGTPAYMAPEILEDAAYSASADIYSVGMVLYEMLAGANPLLGNTLAATLSNVLTVRPRPLSEVRPDIPAALGEAVMACLARRPEQRPPDLTGVQDVVHDLLADSGVRGRSDRLQPGATRSLLRLPTELPARPADATAAAPAGVALRTRTAAAVGVLVVVVLGGWLWSRRAPKAPAVAVPSAAPATTASAAPTTVPAPLSSATDSPARTRPTPPPVTQATKPLAPRPQPDATPVGTPAPAPPTTLAPRRADPVSTPASAPASLVARPSPQEEAAVLVALSPRSVRRGAAVTLELRGSGLRPGLRARVLRGRQDANGFRVTRQEMVDAGLLRLTVLIDEDVPLGSYAVLLVDATGRATNSLALEVVL